MKEFWDERYKQEIFVYGEQPNVFFKEVLEKLQPKGTILLPAEGEGRNAVFAAKSGLKVTCFDISEQGKIKALKLAKSENVIIDYLVQNVADLQFKENSFDVIAFIYAHFSVELKQQYYKELTKYLKPNGLVIFECFSKKQLQLNKENESSFGPKNIEMLFSKEEVASYFSDFDILQLEEVIIELEEGDYHKGKGSVIRFVGRKKAI
ncbi:bifunctional 2-polyprenyl-6-hydroxyphenol methylase/3-demethylubiquinol 3-O-methyltransferase UbiG [Lutibacter sp. B1]|uniref:class I SAM-dependent methyltransferase n=1 Tax=Lutibacter sp. B1 TaxID=2725996 RepID=UPI001457182E|nr:class I SAM-dependent methyltransferase [Lutibacter sp. B1]NLP57806.1 class I SAM-dependent methyltransferase [Lutibacter sp. B1]